MRSRLVVRPRFLRRPLVVLQVAESKPYNYDPTVDIAPSGYREVWRDARPEDVAIVREKKENSDPLVEALEETGDDEAVERAWRLRNFMAKRGYEWRKIVWGEG